MKKIALLGLLSISSAFADGESYIPGPKLVQISHPQVYACGHIQGASPIASHEHRVNFGLLNLGYERIKLDSVYVGIDVKLNAFWNVKDTENKTYRLDHFLNGELRVGYNAALSNKDTLTPYLSIGHTLYSLEKAEGNTKHLSCASGGLKYLHRFSETFEMGIHLKGSHGFYHQRYKLDEEKDYLVTVKVGDTVWIPEFGLPMNWHVGQNKEWEIQFEPYYIQIPNVQKTHILGSRLALGYRF